MWVFITFGLSQASCFTMLLLFVLSLVSHIVKMVPFKFGALSGHVILFPNPEQTLLLDNLI